MHDPGKNQLDFAGDLDRGRDLDPVSDVVLEVKCVS